MPTKKYSRTIRLIGSINDENYKVFTKRLAFLESKSSQMITIELMSEGGDSLTALAFAARMRISPCTIRIVALGMIASAAILVLAAGDERWMTKEAWAMVHEDTLDIDGLKVSDMENHAQHFRARETQWAQLLAQVTKADESTWANLHKAETFLTSAQCLDLGLVDELI